MRRNILLLPLALAVVAGCRDQELPTESAPAAASHAVSVGSMIGVGTLPGGTWSFANCDGWHTSATSRIWPRTGSTSGA
jgi:hypothetical protein